MSKLLAVDFSGARAPQHKIWISVADFISNQLHLRQLVPATIWQVGKRWHYGLLVDFVIKHMPAIAGFDFSFTVPGVPAYGKLWRHWVQTLATRYPTADDFRRSLLAQNQGKELKRPAEKQAQAPFAAYNLRMYRQTYYGVSQVVRPLLAQGYSFPAFQYAGSRPGQVVEICPACTLKHRLPKASYQPYKGSGKQYQQQRQHILDALYQLIPFSITSDQNKLLLNNQPGDALDSFIGLYSLIFGQQQLHNHLHYEAPISF